MINNVSKIKSGFSLLEVIVALGVITMGLLGVFSLLTQTIQVQTTNKHHLIGSMLAQEGVELVRNIKDDNYIKDFVWNKEISDSDDTFIISYTGRASIDDTPDDFSSALTKLYFNTGSGFYTHTSVGNEETPFKRLVMINDISASSTIVKCQVDWNDRGQAKNYVAETELHDWR